MGLTTRRRSRLITALPNMMETSLSCHRLFNCIFILTLLLTLVQSQSPREPDSLINWTISRASTCKDAQQLGCRCETSLLKPKAHTKITCSCDPSPSGVQVAQVQGSKESEIVEPNHDIIWVIENCDNLTIKEQVLPKGSGAEMTLVFRNITNINLKEAAFSTTATSGSFSSPSVQFVGCGMDVIPSKGFPSNLERLEFIGSRIGRIHSHAFKQVYINSMTFENSTIENIYANAFDQDLQSWRANNSRFKRIQTNALTGAIRSMNWSTCIVDRLESNAFGALIPRIVIENSEFYLIEANGLAIQEWTSLSLLGNNFHRIAAHAVDLTQRAADAGNLAVINNNIWHDFIPDFIYTGGAEDVISSVENNTVMRLCECDSAYSSKILTTESSQPWFVQQFLNNTKCFITEKTSSQCLNTNATFVFISELEELCGNYSCFKDFYQSIGEFPSPQLPNRLRILAIFIGTLTGAIVVSLLVTMCVFLMKRGDSPKTSETSDITKSFGAPQDFSDVVYKMSQQGQASLPPPQQQPPPPPAHSSFRPRSMLLEDVEMEDKGVQTMPSELSSDVLEGLRDKLSKPESFWDAKETIDHLYGLIQVQSSTPSLHTSPPDVTMHNHQQRAGKNSTLSHPPSLNPPSTSHQHPHNNSHLNHLAGGMTKSLTTSFVNNPKNPPTTSRYAQIQKPKTVLTALCDYGDPTDSQVHIYSELAAHRNRRDQQQQSTFSHKPRPLPPNLPMLCEYNEPKDVQSHVYAELTGMLVPHQIGTATVNPSFRDQNFPRLTQEAASSTTMPARNSSNSTKNPIVFSNSSQPLKRPLPDPPLLSPV